MNDPVPAIIISERAGAAWGGRGRGRTSVLGARARVDEADRRAHLRELGLQTFEELLEHAVRAEPAADHLGRAEVGLL